MCPGIIYLVLSIKEKLLEYLFNVAVRVMFHAWNDKTKFFLFFSFQFLYANETSHSTTTDIRVFHRLPFSFATNRKISNVQFFINLRLLSIHGILVSYQQHSFNIFQSETRTLSRGTYCSIILFHVCRIILQPMKTNLCGRAVVSVSLARSRKKKRLF